MRVENWNPGPITKEIEKKAMDRLATAAGMIMGEARRLVPIGKSRPPYKNGKEWSARRAGALRDTIRVVRLKDDPKMNIRVYAGNKEVYYARWVELGSVHNETPRKPYLRPALAACKGRIKSIIQGGE